MQKSSLQKLHPNIWVATATSFLTDISSEMLVYLIPLFLSNVLGVRMAIVGLVDGVAETTASLLKIYSGALSDKLGKRKWLAVAGYAISTVAKPFLYFANAWGWVSWYVLQTASARESATRRAMRWWLLVRIAKF